MSDATARLFVAVDPPAAVCRELAAWARAALGGRGASRARLLGAETMHVTLCFLGHRPVGELEAIAAAVEACPAEPVELHVGAPLWLPPRRPRSLALEINDDAGELARLHAGVRDAIAAAIDWQPERRRFRAHVTVARLGRDAGGDSGRRGRGRRRRAESAAGASELESPLPPSPQLAFSPRELILYRSLLAPDGASYEAVATRALDASAESSAEPSPSAPSSEAGGDGGEPLAPEPGQESAEPSTSVGREPSSHAGEEPSSQA
ncbi:MAG TPA: RNA 2',3'-cyclic phosphodiesterase [Solirubrobacteraceae bacterium]